MRLIFCQQASKTKQHQNIPNFKQWLTEITQLTALSLTILGFSVFTPQLAQAETARIDDITIERQPNETYDSLVQRAETAATNALEQGFNQSSQITDVSVVILGQHQGAIVPVLAVGVSRPQWTRGSDEFTYFNSARSLLRLDEQQVAAEPPEGGERNPSPLPGQPPNNSNSPGSAREIINNPSLGQPVNNPSGVTPLPGSPALVPRPQAPGIAPVTSPGDNLDTPSPAVNPGTAPTPQPSPGIAPVTFPSSNLNNTPIPEPVSPVTAPTPQALPQVNPTTNPSPNLP